MSDIKKYAMFGLSVLATVAIYRMVVKNFLPVSISGFIGL